MKTSHLTSSLLIMLSPLALADGDGGVIENLVSVSIEKHASSKNYYYCWINTEGQRNRFQIIWHKESGQRVNLRTTFYELPKKLQNDPVISWYNDLLTKKAPPKSPAPAFKGSVGLTHSLSRKIGKTSFTLDKSQHYATNKKLTRHTRETLEMKWGEHPSEKHQIHLEIETFLKQLERSFEALKKKEPFRYRSHNEHYKILTSSGLKTIYVKFYDNKIYPPKANKQFTLHISNEGSLKDFLTINKKRETWLKANKEYFIPDTDIEFSQ